VDRGRQIYRSIDAICGQAEVASGLLISIGVVEAAAEEEFDEAVSRAAELTQRVPLDGVPPVYLDRQQVSVPS
jgi:hypothetical protein